MGNEFLNSPMLQPNNLNRQAVLEKKNVYTYNNRTKMDPLTGGPLLKGIQRTRREKTLGSDTATVTHRKLFI